MKNLYLLLTALILSLGLYAQTFPIAPTKGDGTKENPYQIETLAHLSWLSGNNAFWDKHFIQTADIDAIETEMWNDGLGFYPIGNSYHLFTGIYNGNHHKIIDLTINASSTDYVGFFGDAENGSIEKLILENCNIEGKNNVGGIAGRASNVKFYQCSVTGKVKGAIYVGGFIGHSSSAKIEESFSNATVIGNQVVGGIIGMAALATYIENCYSLSLISSSGANSGGLVGEQNGTTSPRFINNYFAGTFDGIGNYKGGILGRGVAAKTDIGNFWDSQKSGITDNLGKAVAKNSAEMNSLNTFLDAEWHFKLKNSVNNIVWNIGNGRNGGYPYLDWQYPNDDGLDIPLLPIVRATKVETISQDNVKVTLEVDYVGNSIATEFGVCYALNSNPTISDNKVISSSSISDGEFTISISGLAKDKLYFLKAYAINNVGTAYSNEISYIDLSVQVPSGAGTVENPYLISNFKELLWISNNSNSWEKHFVQTADIDATLSAGVDDNQGFIPIGNSSLHFKGSYDANYHKITNLTINRPETNYVGLFGYVRNATIKKLVVDNINIKGNSDVGGIAGCSYNSTFYQISTSGLVEGDNRVGGIIGYASGSLLEESSSNGTLLANDDVAGLIGNMDDSAINNCYSFSSISTILTSFSGGLLGYSNLDKNIITNSYFAGTFFGGPFDGWSNYTGGIYSFGYVPSVYKGNLWDSQKSALTRDSGNAKHKTTLEMTSASTFIDEGWKMKMKNSVDYGIWNIGNGRNDGYPYLNWQNPNDDGLDLEAEPIIDILKIEVISQTEAEVTLSVDYIGNPVATEFGVCYGSDENPITSDIKVISQELINEGKITLSISGLASGETYNFRAYAINNITYGENVFFAFIYKEKPSGEGTVENPYLVSSFENLFWISDNSDSWDKHFVQTDTIDAILSLGIYEGFSPIGNSTVNFTGTYDGNYYKIENLTIKRPDADYVGLFGYANEATIEKLVIENCNIEGQNNVGGIVGYSLKSVINRTSVTGTISGYRSVGGIAGYNTGTIKESCTNGDIYVSYDNNGGIVGQIIGGSIENCYSVSNVHSSTTSASGGLAGFSTVGTVYTNNYFAGTITGTSLNKGGVIAYGSSPTNHKGNFWDKEKSGVTDNVGMARAKGTIEMVDYNTFADAGWDFKLKNSPNSGVWSIGNGKNDGYPYLSWQYLNDEGADVRLKPIVGIVSIEKNTHIDFEVFINVEYVGNPIATEFGVCYGLNEEPIVGDTKVILSDDIREGDFSVIIDELEENKHYYFRTYAINDDGVSYGSVVFQSTLKEQVAEEPLIGDGSKENPYKIENISHLRWLSETTSVWNKHFEQTDDIDVAETDIWNNGAGFSPIGNYEDRFTGTYNANYHKIENLTIKRPDADYIALFGYTDNSTIEKLILENCNIEGKNNVGGIVGYGFFDRIFQTSATGTISGTENVGGILGFSFTTIIEESFSDAIILGDNGIGGIIGKATSTTIVNNSYSLSSISASGMSRSGGIIGEHNTVRDIPKIINNYFAGTFNGSSYFMGGIVGFGIDHKIDIGNFWDSQKSGVTTSVGLAEAKTTAEMTNLSTFLDADWEFKIKHSTKNSIWNIGNERNDGYPYLSWQYPNDDGVDIRLKPIVGTSDVERNTHVNFKISINVEYIGNPIATEIGVCYGLNEEPTVDDNKAISSEEISEGDFSLIIDELEENKYYYFRAYAINEEGVSYGSVISKATFVEHFAEEPLNGDGSQENPYQIENLAHLRWLSETTSVWSKYFEQTADIDAEETVVWNNGEGFSPIGNLDKKFTGRYNGNYHKIKNLAIIKPNTDYIGLFGYTDDAIIQKMIVENCNIKGKEIIGGLIGYAYFGTIYQTSVTGAVAGTKTVGGIIGQSITAKIGETFSNATISGDTNVGGIAGRAGGSTYVENCYSISLISSSSIGQNFGGIVGEHNGVYAPRFINNYFAGTFDGIGTYKGGIIARGAESETDIGNFWDSQKSGVTSNVGAAEDKTTAQMNSISTFYNAGWVFKFKNAVSSGVWNMGNDRNGGYPYLNWQYPDDVGIDIAQAPTVKTEEVEMISETAVEVTFAVEYVGNPIATEFGVCYGLNEEPTIGGTKAISSEEISEGNFSLIIDELEEQKYYYFRAYAINEEGVSYGNIISKFTIIEVVAEEPLNGDGSEANPYEIATLANLRWLSENPDVWNKYFIQTADINAENTTHWNDYKGFSPIGNLTDDFYGSYNGNYHKIENLTINRPETSYQGFLGYISHGTVKNLQLENVNIKGNDRVGGIVGYSSYGTLSQVSVTGSIDGNRYVGGIIGYDFVTKIDKSFSNSIVSGNNYIGGIVGSTSYTTLNDCYSVSLVSALDDSYSGGLIGNNSTASTKITNSYFAGTFNGDSSNKGGIIGYGSTINTDVGNFWDSQISGVTYNVGLADGKTTAEMADVNTFLDAGWSFKLINKVVTGTWNIGNERNDGYPYLNWQYPNDEGVDIKEKVIINTVGVGLISKTELQVNVTVENVGNPIATEFGVYYGLNEEPTVDDNKVISSEEISEGELSFIITNFEDKKTYYFRAYAINEEGISYGSVISKFVVISEFAEKPLNGDGSEANPYEIETLSNLKWVSDNSDVWDKHFIQTADIDAKNTADWNDSKGFSPIGHNIIKFTGSYNGNFHKIENLTINRSETNYQGLMGYIDNANIENLQLENVNIKGKERVGGIAGSAYNSTINKTSVTGLLNGYMYIGGIVGYNNDSEVKESYSSADIYTSYQYNGGIAGYNSYGTIENCYSLSVIHSNESSSSGGIIGRSLNTGSVVKNNYFAGTFTGTSDFKGGVISSGSSPNIYVGNFWDSELSDVTRNIGSAQGKTTAEMTDVNTFLDSEWSFKLKNAVGFGVWNIGNERNDGYPYLSWQHPNDEGVDVREKAVIKTVGLDLISTTEFQVNFAVDYVGNPIATEFGVCYGLNNNPTVEDNKVISSGNISEGEFSIIIDELEENVNYYFRAYAINDGDEVSYGSVISKFTGFETFAEEPLNGDGSEANPYEIATLSNLRWLSENVEKWNKYFVQTANIDAAETAFWNEEAGFSPIGNVTDYFTGSYDGQHYVIENLFIDRFLGRQALFGATDGALIKRIVMQNANIAGKDDAGGIVGRANNSEIYQCSFSGVLSGNYHVGGIVGLSDENLKVEQCFSNGTISSISTSAGGIVGCGGGLISDCYSSSDIDGNNRLGGIIGESKFSLTINNCHFYGSIANNKTAVGGIVGVKLSTLLLNNSFYDNDKIIATATDTNGVGLTTDEMQMLATFAYSGWSMKLATSATIKIWNIGNGRNEGYPYLNWQYPDDEPGYFASKAKVTTTSLSKVSDSEVKVFINLDEVGNYPATTVGVCYSTSPVPTIDDEKVQTDEGIIEGSYSFNISNLENDRLYYFRAYAINSAGVAYGDVVILIAMGESQPSGDGTIETPYLISNLEELLWVSANPNSWDKYFVQTADIDAQLSEGFNSGEGFSPIGNNTKSFTGNYNGNHYKIDGLVINREGVNYQALFGYIENAIVENVVLENVNINGGSNIGGIAGYASKSTISKSSVTGSIRATKRVGGIVGTSYQSSISQSFTKADISAETEYVGGIIGRNDFGSITNNYSRSDISASSAGYLGGIIGNNYSPNTTFENNFFAGTLTGVSSIKGGVIGSGENPKSDLGNFWDSNVSGVSTSIGLAEAKNTIQMNNRNTYLDAGWEMKLVQSYNYGVWNIGNGRNAGYPYLSWQYPEDDGLYIQAKAVVETKSVSVLKTSEVEVVIEVRYVGNFISADYGICYGFSDNPTVDDFVVKSKDGIMESEFSLIIAGLEEDRTYFFRAFATNSAGTAYGDVLEFYLPVYDGPNGSQEKPYQISSIEDLKWLSENNKHWDKHFVQTADIDASETATWNGGKGFSPIGTFSISFTGSYNGNYHTIDGLFIKDSNGEYQGLFGNVSRANIEKLILKNVDIEGGTKVGGVIGSSSGTISQVSVSGSVKGYTNVGGICGYNGGIIKESFSDADVYGLSLMADVGGIVGINYDGTAENNYSKSHIVADGASNIGGIMGYNWFGNVLNNYFAGDFGGESENRKGINGRGNIYDTKKLNFWDKDVCGVDDNSAQAKTTEEMQDINTFLNAGWDFGDNTAKGIWSIHSERNDGYPNLKWINDILYVNIESVFNNKNSTISIAPNPFNDIVSITGSGISRVKVVSTSGVQLLDVKYNNETDITIPTSEFKHGVYLFVVENDGNVETLKLIKR